MSTTEQGKYTHIEGLFSPLNDKINAVVGFKGFTPITEIDVAAFTPVSELPERLRVHPRFLTSFLRPLYAEDDHAVAFGAVVFSSAERSIGDRATHIAPHVPGPDTEHGFLNLVRAVADGLEVTAPLERKVFRDHVGTVPIDEPVLIELHNFTLGMRPGGKKFSATGLAISALRNKQTGENYSETYVYYRDIPRE
jgi:hypothetical protein